MINNYIIYEALINLHNKKDPKEVVVDEFAVQFVALLGIINNSSISYLLTSLLL